MRTVLRATDEPKATRGDFWQDAVASRITGMDLRLEEPPGHRDRIVVDDLGPVRVIESRSGPGEAWRTSRHARGSDADRWASPG
jgi:hypothetical protein